MEECLGSSDPQGRFETAAPHHPFAVEGSPRADITRLAVTQSLRQVGAALDGLFLDSTMQDAEDALRLLDAAQAVHRALVALT